MKVIDRPGKIWTPYEGKLTLATFDERGRIKEKVESENYATSFLTASFQWAARHWLSSRCGITNPTNDASNSTTIDWTSQQSSVPTYATGVQTDFPPNLFPSSVVLTTAAQAENTSSDWALRGAVTAWSYMDGYTGTDTRRGQINATECAVTPTSATFVFDWPTNSGNGTIASVYWAYTLISSSAYFYSADLYMTTGSGNPAPGYGSTWLGDTSPADLGFTQAGTSGGADRGLTLDTDGTHYWTVVPGSVTGNCHLVKRVLGTGAFASQITLTSDQYPLGFCNDNGVAGNWWIWDGVANTLYKYPNAGGAATTSYTAASLGIPNTAAGATSTAACFFYGGYVWIASAGKMYQINASTGALAATLTLASGGPVSPATSNSNACGLYYPDSTNGDELWLAQGSTLVSRYDLSGNWRGSFLSPATWFSGAALLPGNGYITNNAFYNGTVYVQTNYEVSSTFQFGARSLLPTAVTKTNTQTMTLTYEFTYS